MEKSWYLSTTRSPLKYLDIVEVKKAWLNNLKSNIKGLNVNYFYLFSVNSVAWPKYKLKVKII